MVTLPGQAGNHLRGYSVLPNIGPVLFLNLYFATKFS